MFNNDEPMRTRVTISKERNSISTIMRDRISFEPKVTTNINPNELDSSLIFDYDINNGERRFNDGVFSNTEVDINTTTGIGVLKTDGSSTGTWTSEEIQVDNPISIIEIRVNATDAEGTK